MKRNCAKVDGDTPSIDKVCLVCCHGASGTIARSVPVQGNVDCKFGLPGEFAELDLPLPSTLSVSITSAGLGWSRLVSSLDWLRQVCRECKLTVFAFCCVFIAMVGILDTWLVIKYSDSIFEMEQNPICLYLLQQDPQGLMVFVYGKAFGIFVVLCALGGLFRFWKKIAMHVTLAVTFFQFSLLAYLYVLSDFPHYYRIYIDKWISH